MSLKKNTFHPGPKWKSRWYSKDFSTRDKPRYLARFKVILNFFFKINHYLFRSKVNLLKNNFLHTLSSPCIDRIQKLKVKFIINLKTKFFEKQCFALNNSRPSLSQIKKWWSNLQFGFWKTPRKSCLTTKLLKIMRLISRCKIFEKSSILSLIKTEIKCVFFRDKDFEPGPAVRFDHRRSERRFLVLRFSTLLKLENFELFKLFFTNQM